ncbi:MAG: hypothetical protein PVI54_10855 [Desulfobacteraceae bacterium]|jgi:hypothetical protein
MKWMEFIKIQTASPDIAAKIPTLIEQYKACQGLLEIKVFRHASVDDCSLCLCWDTDSPEPWGSSVGFMLCDTLKQYGLVDHTVWIENGNLEEKAS